MLIKCPYCNSKVVMPKPGICQTCESITKLDIQCNCLSQGNDKQALEDKVDPINMRKGFLPVVVSDHVFEAGEPQQENSLLIDDIFGNSDLSELQHPENIADVLGSQAQFKKNIRVATRFIREDIAVSINVPGLLSLGKTIAVELIDIASRGVQISTNQRLGINKKITLTLQFKSDKIFVIKGIVVRCSDSSRHEYGIKFDQSNNELGDYLLETQAKLIFK